MSTSKPNSAARPALPAWLEALILKWEQLQDAEDAVFGGCTSREDIDLVKNTLKRCTADLCAAWLRRQSNEGITVVYVEGHDGKSVAAPCCLSGCQYDEALAAGAVSQPHDEAPGEPADSAAIPGRLAPVLFQPSVPNGGEIGHFQSCQTQANNELTAAASRPQEDVCTNCNHSEPHNGPACGTDDACTHPCCNCGFDSRGDTSAQLAAGVASVSDPPRFPDIPVKDALYLSDLAYDHAGQVQAGSETLEYALRTVAVCGYERAAGAASRPQEENR